MATKKTRRICIRCGRKRTIDNMKEVARYCGRYYQADKQIIEYACTRKEYISDKSCFEKHTGAPE